MPDVNLEVVFGVGMVVFVPLNEQEGNTQQHGQPHERDRPAAVVVNQRMVGDG
jgi:hypothetical protein